MLTQCPNCKTVFRITAEQLHAVNGMVRCGFCYGTFSALQNLTESLSDIPPSDVPDEEIFDETPLIAEPAQAPAPQLNTPPPKKDTPVRPSIRTEALRTSTNDISLLLDNDDNEPFDDSLADMAFEPEKNQQPELPKKAPPKLKPAPKLPANSLRSLEPKRSPAPPPTPAATPKPKAPVPVAINQPTPKTESAANFFEAPPVFQQPSDPVMVAGSRMRGRPLQRRWNFSASAWMVSILILTLLIFVQYSYFMRNELARVPSFRPWLETLCGIANCKIPMLRDITRISLVSRDMRSHPTRAKALLVRATLVNEAPFVQPFPELKLLLSDLNGTVISSGQFKPEEYINPDTADITAGMLPQTHYDFQLELVDADLNAVSFEFQFL